MLCEDYEYEQQKGHLSKYADFKGVANVPKKLGFKAILKDDDDVDIDENGTTSIKSLSVDDVNGLNVKGWYTVGGMKMQNAPTQKGVYIKDGKKVIIK